MNTVLFPAFVGNRAARSFMHKCISVCTIFLTGKKSPLMCGTKGNYSKVLGKFGPCPIDGR